MQKATHQPQSAAGLEPAAQGQSGTRYAIGGMMRDTLYHQLEARRA